jgi:hypothetical protein
MTELPAEIKRLIVKEKRQRERWDAIIEQIKSVRTLDAGALVCLTRMRDLRPGILTGCIVLKSVSSIYMSPFMTSEFHVQGQGDGAPAT